MVCKICGKEFEDYGVGNKTYTNYCCRECNSREYYSMIGKLKKMYLGQIKNSKSRGHKGPSYTFNDMVYWAFDNGYRCLYNDWCKSGYKKSISPSIDRLDDYRGYSFDNIRLTIWSENFKKLCRDVKNGFNKKKTKEVVQIDVDLNVIKVYNSSREAQRNGYHASSVIRCCDGEYITYKGYYWARLVDIKIEDKKVVGWTPRAYSYIATPVIKLDKKMNLISIYKKTDDVKSDGFTPSNVSACCSGNQGSHKGFIWKRLCDIKELRVGDKTFRASDDGHFGQGEDFDIDEIIEAIRAYGVEVEIIWEQ